MVLLISELAKIGATKPIFLDSGTPRRGGGVRVCVGNVCYHCIVHILNSRGKLYFLCLTVIYAGHIPLLFSKKEP